MVALIRHIGWIVLLLAPVAAWGQAGPDTVSTATTDTTIVELPGVTVEAEHARIRSETQGMRVTSLDASAIEETDAQSVAELLEARSELFVRRYGAGGLATASLRGTNSNQTLVLLDGHRVADPQSGQVDLSLLPTVLLEGVDVLHGAHSARHGSDGIGGVVHLHTLQPGDDWHGRVTGHRGAYDDENVGGVVSGSQGPITGLVAAEASQAERDFPYVDESRFPPETRRRDGADRTHTTAFARLGYEREAHNVHVTGWMNDVERGIPGASNASASGARQWDSHRRLMARYETQWATGELQLNGRVQHTDFQYENPRTDTQTDTETTSYALHATAHQDVGPDWSLTGGAEAGFDRADLRGEVHRTHLGAFLQGTGTLGRFTLYPALRVDAYRPKDGASIAALSPQLGVNVQPLAWEGWRLKGHIGRAFRAPTFGEQFTEPGGNPDLDAERGWTGEIGTVLRATQVNYFAQVELTAFQTRIRDQIVWNPSFAGPGVQMWRPSNVGRVITQGIEATLEGSWQPATASRLDGGVTFTHTRAENCSNPSARSYRHQLRYTPVQQLKLFAGFEWRDLRLDVNGRLVSERFVTTDESQALPPYQVVDAQLRYRAELGPVRATLGLSVDNIFDTSYEIIRLYPMPPRHARLRLTLDTQ